MAYPRRVQSDVTELSWTDTVQFLTNRDEQWASSRPNALQYAPFNGVGGLRDNAYVRVN